MATTEPKVSTFKTLIEQLARTHDVYKVFSTFCAMAACALSLQTREEEYMETIKGWKKEELMIFKEAFHALIGEMQEQPHSDILGGFYMEIVSNKSKQWNGEYHTPQPVCEMMAQMIMGDVILSGEKEITVLEPACGGGAMILACAKVIPKEALHRLRVTAIDVSKVACDMCYINTTLWGIPAEIYHGNTLSMKFFKGWRNIHWIFRGKLHLFAPPAAAASIPEIETTRNAILLKASKEQGTPPTSEKITQIKAGLEQGTFNFDV
ncbi:MAG: N-6 DNA methylase [Puniceicoccales bacterium]|jgi:hypothetical protein|nr:N-6 DNA methylase [Puniceicoccales bacterium]